MFNHARTLLANLSGQDFSVPLEELIPASYRPLELPTALAAVRRRLYGAAPDRWMINYRTRQLLAVTHASQLEEWLLALDPRITYRLDAETTLDLASYEPAVYGLDGWDATLLTINGSPEPPDATGISYHAFTVTSRGEGLVRVQRTVPPQREETVTVTATASLSEPVPLYGSGYSCKLRTFDSGARWFVEVINRPARDLGQLTADLEALSTETLEALFGVVTEGEPFDSCRNLWRERRELPLRLGAVVVAYVYRLAALLERS